ncbi:MAG: ROK family protein [Devosia sp.]|uniref:ROK family protein n=1 Tax=Devosia sp. TaxID=1871048 RepID=UPI001AC24B9D|nr:ROK family protein [Devosia sp.]MBN9317506.1 ROK family protein [Devosia sp.]
MSEVALAVDIGGTKILVGLVAADGTILRSEQAATPAREGPDAIIATVVALAEKLRRADVTRCGVGTAGVVGEDGEITSATDHLSRWAGTPLRRRLAEALGLPVTVLNDVQAVGLCEALLGAARGHRSALMLALGTGVGGAIARNGVVERGAHGIAGSVGHHLSPVRRGRRCPCGGVDHLEAYASGTAMQEAYRERTGHALGLREIAVLAQADDADARAVIAEAAEVLGAVIGSANNVIDAEIVVVGGGVLALGDMLLAPARDAAKREALGASRTVQIVPARYGPTACLIGAGLAALQSGPAGG